MSQTSSARDLGQPSRWHVRRPIPSVGGVAECGVGRVRGGMGATMGRAEGGPRLERRNRPFQWTHGGSREARKTGPRRVGCTGREKAYVGKKSIQTSKTEVGAFFRADARTQVCSFSRGRAKMSRSAAGLRCALGTGGVTYGKDSRYALSPFTVWHRRAEETDGRTGQPRDKTVTALRRRRLPGWVTVH